MRIVLDAMGSDNCPEPELGALLEAVRKWGGEYLLVGPEDELRARLQTLAGSIPAGVHFIHAPERITMQDKGLALALKVKRKGSKTSMAVGMDLVKDGQADAFVTAGNTGGVLATAFFRLGTLPGVERPAVTGLFPTSAGYCAVLDIGANPECQPENLVQFAIMGSIYVQKILKIEHPRVGLLSNGEEPGKGNELVKKTYPLLEVSGLNFFGNVESKEIFSGQVDVVVTDGFSGNIFLKTTEAAAKMLMQVLKDELLRTPRTKLGAALAKPAFNRVRKVMDPGEYGAAPLLGIEGLVFKGHGRSDARAMFNAIRVTRQAVEANLLGAIRSAIQKQMEKTRLQVTT